MTRRRLFHRRYVMGICNIRERRADQFTVICGEFFVEFSVGHGENGLVYAWLGAAAQFEGVEHTVAILARTAHATADSAVQRADGLGVLQTDGRLRFIRERRGARRTARYEH